MTPIPLIFYFFSFLAVCSAILVVISTNPVRSVLFLILTFFNMAVLWLLLDAEFLSLILVLVYVGAVMTLFLFVVMMLKVNVSSIKKSFVRYLPFSIFTVLVFFGIFLLVMRSNAIPLLHMAVNPKPEEYSNLTDLGSVLYTVYVYPFECAAVILLTAIVAAISLTHRPARNRTVQKPHQQVKIRRRDRIRLVKMPSASPTEPIA